MDGRLKRDIKLLDLDKFKLAVEDIEQKRNTGRPREDDDDDPVSP